MNFEDILDFIYLCVINNDLRIWFEMFRFL